MDTVKVGREKKLVNTVLNIKDKYGKNAILRGLDLDKRATQKKGMNKLEDIKVVRIKMPREKRAAQFAPFDALSGMREALAMVEYENERKAKGDVSEETTEKIANIVNELEKDTVVKVRYYDDGYDKEYTGAIRVDIFERKIKLIAEKKTINLDDLLDMNLF